MPRKQTSDIETYADVKVLQDWRTSVDSHLADIDDKLDKLPDLLVKKLDERYASKEQVNEIAETVEPLTKLRKRLWYFVIALIIAQAVALLVVVYDPKNWIK